MATYLEAVAALGTGQQVTRRAWMTPHNMFVFDMPGPVLFSTAPLYLDVKIRLLDQSVLDFTASLADTLALDWTIL